MLSLLKLLFSNIGVVCLTSLALAIAYLYRLNTILLRVPPEAEKLCPREKRWTDEQIRDAAKELKLKPMQIEKYLPPKQKRRYVVVGGGGFIGGYIARNLVARGEDPRAVRVVDIHEPAEGHFPPRVQFCRVNVKSIDSVKAAFSAPWPKDIEKLPLTVYDTVAVIRPWERSKDLLPHSEGVNIEGTKNVLSVAKQAGASVFIFTASTIVPVRRPKYWIAPWQSSIPDLVQIYDHEGPADKSRPFEDYPNNYAYTKAHAERLVCEADDPVNGFRTGCIRPSSIHGLGDLSVSAYVQMGQAPTWIRHCMNPWVHAESVVIAHMFYEQRLIELSQYKDRPDIGGQTFIATDRDAMIPYDSVYRTLEILSDGKCKLFDVPPVLMLLVAHFIETYDYLRRLYVPFLPKLPGDAVFLQPGIFPVTLSYILYDDAKARLPVEQGGLGYYTPWTTIAGVSQITRQVLDLHKVNPELGQGGSVFEKALKKMEAEALLDSSLVQKG